MEGDQGTTGGKSRAFTPITDNPCRRRRAAGDERRRHRYQQTMLIEVSRRRKLGDRHAERHSINAATDATGCELGAASCELLTGTTNDGA